MTDPRQFHIYQSEDGFTCIDVMLKAETPWLNQGQLTELFDKAKRGEFSYPFFRTTLADGKQRTSSFFRFNYTAQQPMFC